MRQRVARRVKRKDQLKSVTVWSLSRILRIPYIARHQLGGQAQDRSWFSYLKVKARRLRLFGHITGAEIIRELSEQRLPSTVSRRTGGVQEVDRGGPGSVPLNSTSNHTTWASTHSVEECTRPFNGVSYGDGYVVWRVRHRMIIMMRSLSRQKQIFLLSTSSSAPRKMQKLL